MLLFPTDSYGYFFDELLALTGADRARSRGRISRMASGTTALPPTSTTVM